MNLSDAAELLADQSWRISNLYTISTKEGVKAPFRLNWAQQAFYSHLWHNNIILKARQLGMSTCINILMLDTCLFNPHIECGIIAHTEQAGKDLLRRNIRQVYDDLPDALKELVPITADSAHHLRFANGSGIRVATTMRSSSLQMLHISEFGKICAQYPPRAREIVTGSLESVGKGNIVVIESTAEGTDGYFHDYCQTARALQDGNKSLSPADFKFFFFPWWDEPSYALSTPHPVDDALRTYFTRLESDHGIALTPAQQHWYAAKAAKLDEDVYREYPSTADEAFRTSLDGSYYLQHITRARKEGRIGFYPADPRYPFRVYMDLGVRDDSTMIFEQVQQGRTVIFDYIENNSEPIQWYVNKIQEHLRSGLILDRLILPHDCRQRDLASGKSLEDVVLALGVKPIEVLPPTEIVVGIQAVRDRLMTVHFHEQRTARLVKHLENYRRDWNTRLGVWSEKPRHDEHSHAADALRYWAVTDQTVGQPRKRDKRPVAAILR